MIELSQIPVSSKLKDLRGQINTMVNEINTNQMVLGRILNPSLNYYDINAQLVGAVTASNIISELFALCMPESNGLFIGYIFGRLLTIKTPELTDRPVTCEADIPAIKIPNRDSAISTFVTMEHMGLSLAEDTGSYYQCGTSIWDVMAKYTPSGGNVTYVSFSQPTLRVSLNGGATLRSAAKY